MDTKNLSNIFIVDDDFFCRTIYEQQLSNLGYKNITVFDNGIACLQNLTADTDIVFLDYNMQHLNGIEVLQQIKTTNPNVYVVLISGQEDIQIAVTSLTNGAFDYIVKGGNDYQNITKVLNKIHTAKELMAMQRNSVVF